MLDPVELLCGHMFERDAIVEWSAAAPIPIVSIPAILR